MIEIQTDEQPLYSSTKDEPLTSTDKPTILTSEPIEMAVVIPELKTVTEPEKQVDFGNGLYALKPTIPVKTPDNKKLYIDLEKLLTKYNEAEAKEIISKVENNDIDDNTLQSLILDNIISDTQPTKEKKTKNIISSFVNFIYNLIYL